MRSLKLIRELFTSKHLECIKIIFGTNSTNIFRHPLFSLLAFLLEKCENATQGNIQMQSEDKDNNNGKPDKNQLCSSSDDINVSYYCKL